MEIKKDYKKVLLVANGTMATIRTTSEIEQRGAFLGSIENIGTHITIESPYRDIVEMVLPVLDHKHPNCETGLVQQLEINIRLHQLGVFGEIEAPHRVSDSILMQALRTLVETHSADVERNFVQIPIEMDGRKHWEIRTQGGYVYTAVRRYMSGYYLTKIKRTAEDFIHPLNAAAKPINVVGRFEAVKLATKTACPLDFKDVGEYFR